MPYTVKSGDTLSKIAAANKTTVSKIIAANPVLTTNPKYNGGSTIFSGTKLNLPGDTKTPPATSGTTTSTNTGVVSGTTTSYSPGSTSVVNSGIS